MCEETPHGARPGGASTNNNMFDLHSATDE
jgi:hypothetical protein